MHSVPFLFAASIGLLVAAAETGDGASNKVEERGGSIDKIQKSIAGWPTNLPTKRWEDQEATPLAPREVEAEATALTTTPEDAANGRYPPWWFGPWSGPPHLSKGEQFYADSASVTPTPSPSPTPPIPSSKLPPYLGWPWLGRPYLSKGAQYYADSASVTPTPSPSPTPPLPSSKPPLMPRDTSPSQLPLAERDARLYWTYPIHDESFKSYWLTASHGNKHTSPGPAPTTLSTAAAMRGEKRLMADAAVTSDENDISLRGPEPFAENGDDESKLGLSQRQVGTDDEK